ncbi:MAG: phage head-tail adapter protein [Alphaproteobacteria bacterium]|nr:MAG: phage head-tail adapter protein [Alphaproteobacteria bacterium]
MFDPSAVAENVLKRFQTVSRNRGTWEAHWEEVARRVLPSYSGSFIAEGDSFRNGEKRTEDMVDATGALALPRFAAVYESLLTPRNSIWHRIVPADPILKRNRAARLWFEEVRDVLFKHRYAPRANYSSQQYDAYLSMGAFGTGALFIDAIDPRYGMGLRYKAVHLGQVYFLENHQGIIDTVFRRFELTARQAAQRYGVEKLPDKIRQNATDPAKGETRHWFVNCVKPREEAEGFDPERVDVRGMAWADYTVAEDGRHLVHESGMNTFPYSIPRYITAPGEIYGRGPAMLVLPSLKVLNEQKKTLLKQGHKAVDPVLLAHDDGVLDSMSLKPGAVNYGGVTADGRPLVHTLPVGRVDFARELMEEERATINDAFLITLFQILVESPQMTATEVLERTREKGILLNPTMGRQQSEALGPLIERELDVLAQQGLLPPMPDIVRDAGGEFAIEYDSPLSRAARAEEAAGLLRLVDWARDYVNITGNPAPLDHINWDAAMPELAEIHAVPVRWINSPEVVAQIRQSRAQQADIQTAIEAGPAAAGLAKAVPELAGQGAG